MPEDSAQRPVTLSWFYGLDLRDQVELLSNPRQLSQPLADLLKSMLGPGSWSPHPTDPTLDGRVLHRLEQIRRQLDNWWDGLIPIDQKLLIGYRIDENPPAHWVAIAAAQAREIGERLEMARVYVEMQARRLGQA
jgi:hypothetical protein